MAVKGKDCGRMSVPVCRDAKGKFRKRPGAKKRKTTSRKKMAKGAACAPKTMWKDGRGVCHCRTKGGGSKVIRAGARCKKIRRRKAPKR